ncbi:MAG: hypothetical protein QM811_15540 [Pirellulales bacterium]
MFSRVWIPFFLVPLAVGMVDLHEDYTPYRIAFIIAYFIIVAPILLEITNPRPCAIDTPAKT